jgi:hypothetical protein
VPCDVPDHIQGLDLRVIEDFAVVVNRSARDFRSPEQSTHSVPGRAASSPSRRAVKSVPARRAVAAGEILMLIGQCGITYQRAQLAPLLVVPDGDDHRNIGGFENAVR